MIISVDENTWGFWVARISHSCWHWPKASLFSLSFSLGSSSAACWYPCSREMNRSLGIWDLSHETGAASDVMLRGYGSQESRDRAKGLCSTAICLPGTLGTCQYYYERINHYLTFLRITFCAANGRVGLSFSYMIYDVGWFIYITLCTWTEQGASFAMNSLLR